MSYYNMLKNSNDISFKKDILNIINIQATNILRKHKNFKSCVFNKNREDDCYSVLFIEFYVDFIFINGSVKDIIFEFYNNDNESIILPDIELKKYIYDLENIKDLLKS